MISLMQSVHTDFSLKMFLLMIICCIAQAQLPTPGLDAAIRLIKQPLANDGHVKDIILTGVVNQWESHAYKLHILRQRIGHAWEWLMTDYGYERHSCGIDLVNHRQRVAIEIKNSCQVSSTVKHATYKALRDFKSRRPNYRVIFGCINYRNLDRGKTFQRGTIIIMKGTSFLDYLLGTQKDDIINRFQTAARTFVRENS